MSHRDAIAKVLAHIDGNKSEKLDLDELSAIACVSKFHFHRMFREFMGLTLGQYIKLKRLEAGMWRFIHTDEKTLEVALDVGYDSHAGFTRAFTKEMDCSPSDFKRQLEESKRIVLNSQQKNGPEFLGYRYNEAIKVFYWRFTGSYFQSARLAWKELLVDLTENNIPTERQQYYGISQDDPNALGMVADSLRFDVCVEVSSPILRKASVLRAKLGSISGGHYAVFSYKGPLERLTDSYCYVYGKWVFDHCVKLRDERPFIRYIDPLGAKDNTNSQSVEIFLPVEV